MLQSLYGYRAIDAGLVLGPGALLMLSMLTGAAAMWYYSSFSLATDYRHYALASAFQGLG